MGGARAARRQAQIEPALTPGLRCATPGDDGGTIAAPKEWAYPSYPPCIATFMMMWNERGSKVALTTFGLVTLIAVASGALLNQILLALSWQ